MKKMKHQFVLAALIFSAFGILSSCGDESIMPSSSTAASPELKVVSPANPNVFPVFLMMEDNPELNIALTAVDGGSDVPPYFESGEADITTIYSYIMAKHVISGSIPDLQLRAVTLWDNFYLVTNESVVSLDQLMGKTILITGPKGSGKNGPADKILQAAILRNGFNISDFTIEYDLIQPAMDRVESGEADALLLAEPAATGFVAKSTFSGAKLSKSISLQRLLNGYSSWSANQLPLGGVAALPQYDTEEKAAAVEDFIMAYKVASSKIMEDKMSSARIISKGLKTHFGTDLPWPIVLRSLNEGTLAFNAGISISDIQPELNAFITELVGEVPTDDFYKD